MKGMKRAKGMGANQRAPEECITQRPRRARRNRVAEGPRYSFAVLLQITRGWGGEMPGGSCRNFERIPAAGRRGLAARSRPQAACPKNRPPKQIHCCAGGGAGACWNGAGGGASSWRKRAGGKPPRQGGLRSPRGSSAAVRQPAWNFSFEEGNFVAVWK